MNTPATKQSTEGTAPTFDATEDAHRQIINSLNEAVVALSLEGYVKSWNPAAERIFGYTPDQIIGKHIGILTPPELQEQTRTILERVVAGEAVTGMESVRRTRDGEHREVVLNITPMRSAAGTVTGIAGIIQDVSNARKAERTANQWSRLVQQVEWGVAVSAPGSKTIQMVNPAFAAMHGYTENELIGFPIVGLYPPAAQCSVKELMSAALKHGRATMESMHVRKDGSEFPVLVQVTLIRESGVSAYHVAGVLDISEQKRIEEQNRSLENQIAHMSRLTTLGGISAGIAHEINQPLAAILNYADGCLNLIDEGGDTAHDEVRDGLNRISGLTKRMGEVVRRLRLLIRKSRPCRSSVELNKLIEETFSLVEHELEARSITGRLQLDERLPPVLADSIQIQQVLLNLVMNAMEAMDTADERTLFIETSRTDEWAKVSIHDTGCGLGANLQQAFEPFHTTKANGVGLGLSISRTILEAQGGRIWLESDTHVGAASHFALPLQPASVNTT